MQTGSGCAMDDPALCRRMNAATMALAFLAAVAAAAWTGERGYLVLAGFVALIAAVHVAAGAFLAFNRARRAHGHRTETGDAR
jgi:hypothetical protein